LTNFDNLSSVAIEELQELTLLRLTDAVPLEHVGGVFGVSLSLYFSDTETAVRSPHIAPTVETRAAGKGAKLFDGELLHSGFRVEARARSKSCKNGSSFKR
jgi:hypothetical protein